MARRKSKERQREEFIDALLKLSSFGTFFLTYLLTKSLKVSIIIAVIAVAIVITILFFNNYRRVERLKRSGIDEIDKMDGFQFERYLSHLFKALGYEVRLLKSVGDFGADLIISKNETKIAIQAKRYSRNVGIKAVQEAQASIAHYGATEAWVVTNSDFTEAAITLAHSNQVKLINREKLIEMILQKDEKSTSTKSPQQVAKLSIKSESNPTSENVICVRCGSNMVQRKGPRGEFYGCSTFPRCRYTAPI